jgi:DNA-binding MarR family transcriptional regulator
LAIRTAEQPPLQSAELRQYVARQVLRFVEKLHTGPVGPWLDLHLTMPQLKMLFAIDWLGPVPMNQLAAFLRVSVSAATGLLDRLVEQGLAHRETDARDRRVVRAAATERGLALALDLRSAGTDRLGQILEHLSEDELRTCATALELVNRAAERYLEDGISSVASPATPGMEARR